MSSLEGAKKLFDVSDYPFSTMREFGGEEKYAYKLTNTPYGIVCAKIVREKNASFNYPQERRVIAEREYLDNRRLRESKVKEYIPEVYGFITEGKENVGIVTEWKEGLALRHLRQQTIPASLFEDLYSILIALPEQGLLLWRDMYSDANLMYDEGGQRLWFAESKVQPGNLADDTVESYRSHVQREFDDHVRNWGNSQ